MKAFHQRIYKFNLGLLALSLTLLSAFSAYAGGGELIVFLHDESHPVTKDFREKTLPELQKMADAQGFALKEINAAEGAPELIGHTPAVVYQNHLGRSLYIGRYHYVNKIKTFMRTVKRLPQEDVGNLKHDVLVWKNERATLVTPVKITPLAGAVPANFDQEAFQAKALEILGRGMKNYDLHKEFDFRRNHRAIYNAYYPYLSEDGKVFLSMEMYSQFNCIEPIYKRFDTPLEGTIADWEDCFLQAAEIMEAEMIRQLSTIEKGDGMVPVPTSVAVKSWKQLDLKLPKAPKGSASSGKIVKVDLPLKWTFDGPIAADVPVLGFSFLAPVDYYAGEAGGMDGDLQLSAGRSIEKATGKFSLATKTLSMGDEMLDHSVHDMVKYLDHPKASFTFKDLVIIENPVLKFGNLTQFSVSGELNFMGIKDPIEVRAQMEPVLDDAGKPRLQVFASFRLRLKEKYNLDGPDGPMPAKDTMVFNLNFLLKPAA